MADVGSLDSEQLLVLLTEIGKAADKIKTSVTGVGEASTRHMKSAGEAMAGVDKQVVSITKNLLGPIGLAAGFAAVTKSLDNFSVGQLQLSNLAKNTSLAASSVLNLQTKFEVAGLGAEGFSRTIGGITSALNNIKTFQEGSQVFGKLSEMLDLKVDGQQIANTVLGFEKVGDRLSAINTLVKGWNQGTERQKLYIEELLHTDRAGMEALQQDIKNVVLVTQQGDAAAKEYHKTWVSVQNTGTNIWNTIANAALTEIARMGGGLEGLKTKSESITKAIAEYFATNLHPAIEREMATIRKLQEFMEYMSKLTEGRQFEQGKGPPGALTAEEFLKRQKEDKEPFNFGKWLDEKLGTGKAKADDDKLPPGARPRSYSPDDVEKDSNKVLHDMRDMMQRSEIKQFGGSAYSGTTFRPGIGTGRGGGGGGETDVGSVMGGKGGGKGAAGTGAEGDTSKVGNEFLASQRAGFAKELENDPQLKLRAAAITSLENEGAGPGVIESAMNRGVLLNKTLKQILAGGPKSFYGPARRGAVEPRMALLLRNPGHLARLNALIDRAVAGSNVTEGATDQGSAGDPNYIAGGRGVNINGERFNDYGVAGSRQFRLTQQEHVRKSAEAAAAARAYNGLTIDEGQRGNLDKSMRGATVTGELNANVNFSNVPPGVKTDAQGKGFKLLRVTASKQGQKSAEGMLGSGDMQYTPWVP